MATLKEILVRRPVSATIRLTVPAGLRSRRRLRWARRWVAFCKNFNARTQKYKADTPMAVTITAFTDITFEFIVKSPSVTWYLKKAGRERAAGARESVDDHVDARVRDREDQAG